MKHGSLFSGIGGFDLAAEWMGWENKFHCEWNEFGQKVLKHYWPDVESFNDITKTDFTKYANRIDILTGGFPCQPYSAAGKRKGKADERHLWPEMLRAIREIKPTWVVGENVLGLVNWSGGLVFDEVQADLEAQGYEVQPFILPACSKNAPHRRDRVWFIAYSLHNRDRQQKQGYGQYENGIKFEEPESREQYSKQSNKFINNGNAPNTNSDGQHGSYCQNEVNTSKGGVDALSNSEPLGEYVTDTNSRRQPSKEHGKTEPGWTSKTSIPNDWQNFPTQSPICTGNDGFSTELDGITFPKYRNESIKGAGNAIVPQVALEIFKAIETYETRNKSERD